MSTTQLYVELIVIGIETSIWIVFTIVNITNVKIMEHLKAFMNAIPATIFALGILYVMGMIVDRIADFLFERLDKNMRGKSNVKGGSVFKIYKDHDSLDFFNYLRARIRILRATVINCPLITISIAIFIFNNYYTEFVKFYYFVIASGVITTVCTYLLLRKQYYDYFKKARKMELDDSKIQFN